MPSSLKGTFFNFGGGQGTGNTGTGFPAAGMGMGTYGGIPIVPDPTQTATQAIQGNIGNLASLYGLGTGLSNITAAEARGQYEANLPGYGALTSKASSNIGEDLAGQLPADVISLLQQQAAERGVATGSPDSPNSNAAYLRALGLTSLGRKDLGQQELTAAIGRTPTGPLFDPSRMLVTPEQQQAAAAAQRLYNAAPNPRMAAAEAERLARMGLGSGAGSVGGAPGLRSPVSAQRFDVGGGNMMTAGPSSRTKPTPFDDLGLTPEQRASFMDFWNQDWDVLNPPDTGGQFDWQSLLQSPGLQDTGTLGMGLDPELNAILGTGAGGLTGQQPGQYFDFTTGGFSPYQQQPNIGTDYWDMWGSEGP